MRLVDTMSGLGELIDLPTNELIPTHVCISIARQVNLMYSVQSGLKQNGVRAFTYKKNETTALIAFLKLSQLLDSFEDLYCLFVLIMSLVRFKFENFSYRCSFSHQHTYLGLLQQDRCYVYKRYSPLYPIALNKPNKYVLFSGFFGNKISARIRGSAIQQFHLVR